MPRNKRKREEENEETVDDKSVAKKTCRRFDSSEGTFRVDFVLASWLS